MTELLDNAEVTQTLEVIGGLGGIATLFFMVVAYNDFRKGDIEGVFGAALMALGFSVWVVMAMDISTRLANI